MNLKTSLETLRWLGVYPSHYRPRVSNENAYAASPYQTSKYCFEYLRDDFGTQEHARAWILNFVTWCNTGHRRRCT